MKTNTLISALLLSSVLGLSACARDTKLTSDRRPFSNNNKPGGNSTSGGGDDFNLKSTYSMSAVLGERQIEVIELIKVATASLDANTVGYKVEQAAVAEEGVTKVSVSTVTTALSYKGVSSENKMTVDRKLDVAYTVDAEGVLKTFSAKPAVTCGKTKDQSCWIKMSADSQEKKKFYVNVQETAYTVEAVTGQNPEQLIVTLTTTGTVDGAKGGGSVKFATDMTMTLIIDKASLATSQVNILSTNISFNYPNQNKPDSGKWNLTMKAENMVANLESNCNSLAGKASFLTDPKKPANEVEFTANDVSIVGKNWTKPLAECGKRPSVDVHRLQVF